MFSFFSRKKTDPKTNLRKVLGDYELPSFPGAITETLQRIRDPESSAHSIADTLAVDPGLSVRVLRAANSAAFSPSKRVENLTQAVALVGLSQLESLVLSVAVSNAIPRRAAPGYNFTRFWRAAARRGVVARSLANILCPAKASESFTAGLLQDMAIPFLAHLKPDVYGPILERWHKEDGRLPDLEREALDWDHAEVATWICADWTLPENIASAIGGHHDPQSKDYICPAPVSLVSLIHEEEQNLGVDGLIEAAHSQHGLSPEQVKDIVESSFEDAEELARLMT